MAQRLGKHLSRSGRLVRIARSAAAGACRRELLPGLPCNPDRHVGGDIEVLAAVRLGRACAGRWCRPVADDHPHVLPGVLLRPSIPLGVLKGVRDRTTGGQRDFTSAEVDPKWRPLVQLRLEMDPDAIRLARETLDLQHRMLKMVNVRRWRRTDAYTAADGGWYAAYEVGCNGVPWSH